MSPLLLWESPTLYLPTQRFDSKTRINFIVINMQYLQYLFYSLLSLQKHRICVKGHQNNLQNNPPPFLNFWICHCYLPKLLAYQACLYIGNVLLDPCTSRFSLCFSFHQIFPYPHRFVFGENH